ncbi:hypothetical protein QTP88_020998 [Uroleucon formosanum]
MVNCTNIKSVVETGKSIKVTSIEMKRFIGCNIFMSSLGYPRMRMFWEKTIRVPLISNTMSRNRFFNIRSILKVVNDNAITNEEKKDSLWKVRPLLETVKAGCYRGKPNPTGLKNFILVNKHGLVLDFCVYQGKGSSFITESKYPLTVGESAVINLSKTISPEKKIPQLLDFRITLAHELINSTQEDDSEDSDDKYVDCQSNSGNHVPLSPVKIRNAGIYK